MVDFYLWSIRINLIVLLLSLALVLGIRYLLTQRGKQDSSQKAEAVSLLWMGVAILIMSEIPFLFVWDHGSMFASVGYIVGDFLVAFFLYCLDRTIFEKRLKFIPAIVASILGVMGVVSLIVGIFSPFRTLFNTISSWVSIILVLGLVVVIIFHSTQSRINLHTAIYLGTYFGLVLLGQVYYIPLTWLFERSPPELTYEDLWMTSAIINGVLSLIELFVLGLVTLTFQAGNKQEVGSFQDSPSLPPVEEL